MPTSFQTSLMEVHNSDSNRMPVASSTLALDGIPDKLLLVFHIIRIKPVPFFDAHMGNRSSCTGYNSLRGVLCDLTVALACVGDGFHA